MYIINLLLLLIIYIICSNLNYHLTPIFALFALTNVFLIIIKPKWKLSERVIYVTTEEKKEILEYNNKIRSEITATYKFPKYLIVVTIITIILFIAGVVYNNSIKLESQSNERDKNVQQLEIKNNYINIRKNTNTRENAIGKVYKGEIYTILETKKSSDGIWYKITTEYGVTGYIYSGKNNEYITILSD